MTGLLSTRLSRLEQSSSEAEKPHNIHIIRQIVNSDRTFGEQYETIIEDGNVIRDDIRGIGAVSSEMREQNANQTH